MSNFVDFESREDLHRATAGLMADGLKAATAERGEAFLALSGGGTPAPVYEALSVDASVPWDKVEVTLADERLTPPGHADSNETLVRNTLLKNDGAAASFSALDDTVERLPRQDVILLGMGGDGHFASLFPGAAELPAALDPAARPVMRVVPDPMPAHAPYERLTLTLPAILDAEHLILAITGAEKRAVLEEATNGGPVEDLPIRALLRADHPSLLIHWAP